MPKLVFPFLVPLFTSLFCLSICSPLQAEPEPKPVEMHQESDVEARKLNYGTLMLQGDSGYRKICELIASGKIKGSELITWEYDFATRHDSDAGLKFDNYLYDTSEKDEKFLEMMSKGLATSDFPSHVFVEMMQVERRGARLLGSSALLSRYKDAPSFSVDALKSERDEQISKLEKFLLAQPRH